MAYVRRRVRATPELKALVEDVVNSDLQVKAAVDRLKLKLITSNPDSYYIILTRTDAELIAEHLNKAGRS